ncbi:universal stress protein [Pandoraea apista]|nr:universal stress protein [Pandoraea apista]
MARCPPEPDDYRTRLRMARRQPPPRQDIDSHQLHAMNSPACDPKLTYKQSTPAQLLRSWANDNVPCARRKTMSLRRICVHVDDTATSAARLRFSGLLARQHDASLAGIYLPHRPGAVHSGQPESSGVHYQTEGHSQAARQSAEHLFKEVCAEHDISGDWHSPFGAPTTILSNFSKGTDLCIVGQPDAPGGVAALGVDGLGDIIVSAGTPILGLPHNVTFPREIRRIVVAWNGSREARRAIGDAWQLLGRAQDIFVVGINRSPAGDDPSLADIVRLMEAHGLRAKAVSVRQDTEASDGVQLLATVEAHEADLLVMGAYGHGPTRERVFGGATRTVLKHMSTPVLFSH